MNRNPKFIMAVARYTLNTCRDLGGLAGTELQHARLHAMMGPKGWKLCKDFLKALKQEDGRFLYLEEPTYGKCLLVFSGGSTVCVYGVPFLNLLSCDLFLIAELCQPVWSELLPSAYCCMDGEYRAGVRDACNWRRGARFRKRVSGC